MTSANRRTKWLEDRQSRLCATDVASIAGVGFHTAMEVYEEKVAPEPIDRAPSLLMQMGLATEEINSVEYEKRTGTSLFSPGLVTSPSSPWMGATVDRIVACMSGPPSRAVELKYVGPFFGDRWGDDGGDEVPDAYLVQVTWQAKVLRHKYGTEVDSQISALSGSGDHRIYTVPYDDRLAMMLYDLGLEFWFHIKERRPPIDWSHPLQADIANRLAELRPDLAVELGEESLNDVREYQLLKEREKEAKAEAEAVKLRLIGALCGAGEGRLPDGQRITQKIVNRKAYAVEATSYVDFRISKPKKAKV